LLGDLGPKGVPQFPRRNHDNLGMLMTNGGGVI
jgi:hypothetical protein